MTSRTPAGHASDSSRTPAGHLPDPSCTPPRPLSDPCLTRLGPTFGPLSDTCRGLHVLQDLRAELKRSSPAVTPLCGLNNPTPACPWTPRDNGKFELAGHRCGCSFSDESNNVDDGHAGDICGAVLAIPVALAFNLQNFVRLMLKRESLILRLIHQ